MTENETNEEIEGAAPATDAHDHDQEGHHHHHHGHDQDHDHDHGAEQFEFVEDPVFEIAYKGDCAYEVAVTIPVANEAKQADEIYNELSEEAEVRGFRRGRAPRKLIERKFFRVVKNEVEGKLVSAAFGRLIKDNKLRPIALPDVDGLEAAKERPAGAPLQFTLKFEVSPRVELGMYRGIEIERPVLTVNEDDVGTQIRTMLERNATFEPVTEGVAADGDQVLIDFVGKVDDVPFPGGSATDYPYILGTKRFFPEFEAALVGASPGDEVTCEVTFPDDYREESLRGKTAQFTITLKELNRRVIPELTDETAKSMGFDSADDARAKVADRLRESATETSTRLAERNALDAVIAASAFEMPKSLVDRVAEEHYAESVQQMLSMRVPYARIREQEEELRAHARDNAVAEIKRVVVLNEIGEAEAIEVSDDDLESEMELMAARIGVGLDMIGDYIGEDAERRSRYEDRIYRAKALKVIMDNAIVTDKEVTEDELEERGQDGKAGHEGSDE